jgi:HlyD family secretion protein
MNPKSHRLLWVSLGVIALLGTALGAYFLNGNDTPTETETDASPPGILGTGHVDPEKGIIRLYPGQTGLVKSVVEEGKRVKEGDPLLRLDDRIAKAQLKRAQADLNNAKSELQKAENEKKTYPIKIRQQETAIEIAKKTADAAESQHEYAKLALASRAIVEAELKTALANLEKAKENIKLEQDRLKQLREYDPEIDIERAQANVDDKEARLDMAQHALEETELKAPFDGEVLRVDTNVGERLGSNPRGPAIEFAATGPRVVRAEVLQEWADRVFKGQDVLIEKDPRGNQQWKGKVKSISDWIQAKRPQMFEPVSNDVRTLNCVIEITSDTKDLRIGQRVRVTFLPKK